MPSKLAEPVSVLVERLNYHAARGQQRMLDGWRFIDRPLAESEAADDFPCVRVQEISFDEPSQSRPEVLTNQKIVILVSTRKTDGMVQHMEGVSRVLASLETDTAGSTDTMFGQTTPAGLKVSVPGQKVTALEITSVLTLSVQTRPYRRGKQRLT